MAETIPLPDDLPTRAAERLADIRQRLAFFVLSKKESEGLTFDEIASAWKSNKNMVFRITRPDDPRYDGPQIGPMMLALEWCGIGLADLESLPSRPVQLADISAWIMRLPWPESKRLALRSATEHLWRVLEAM